MGLRATCTILHRGLPHLRAAALSSPPEEPVRPGGPSRRTSRSLRGGQRPRAPPPCVMRLCAEAFPGACPVARRPHCSSPPPARLPVLASLPAPPVASGGAWSCSVCTRVPGEASWPGRRRPQRRWTLPVGPSNRRPSPRGSRASRWEARLAGPGGRMRGRLEPDSRPSSGGNGAAG